MAAWLDICRYLPTAGGTTDWTYSSAVTGYQSPTAAGVTNSLTYRYRAESGDLSQWEIGYGLYNTGTGVLARTTVLFNNLGTTAKINFSAIPQVAIVALKEDMISIEEANSFSTAQQAQARTNIYAAPFEAMSCTGLQINGSMDVSQDIGTTLTTLVSGGNKGIMDCWTAGYTHGAGTAVIKVQQVTPPGSPSFGAGFQNCVQMSSPTPMSPAAGDYALIQQAIEGYRWSKLGFGNSAAQSVTIGFWAYATVAGTACISLRNSANNRSYPSNFNINGATTWEYKTVTIPGDTSGTWLTTNGIGAYLDFAFACGSTFQGTNNTWSATNSIGTSAIGNFFAVANNVVAITGVVVLPGTDAPTAARSPMVMRSYDSEFLLSCRYYWKSTGAYPSIAGSTFVNTAIYGIPISHPVIMRTTPTVTIVGTWAVAGCGQPTASQITEIGFTLQVTGNAATNVAANPNGSTTYLTADARL